MPVRVRRGLGEYVPSNRFPDPWPGGWWRLRDIIDYELAFGRSLIGSLSREPQFWLRTGLEASQRVIERGADGAPIAWLIPSDNRDPAAVRRLVDVLLLGGVEIDATGGPVEADGRTYPAGSLVIRRDQPYGSHVKDLFEVQRYPAEGRAYTIPELVEMGYAGRDLRLFLIKKHYRAPLPFRLDLLDEARTIRSRLNNFVHHEMADRADGSANPAVGEAIARARRDFRAALEDDINASEALAALQVFMTTANRLAPSRAEAAEVVAFMRETDQVLGVLNEASEVDSEDPEIAALLADREKARRDRDFARADAIRDALHERGIEIFDTPEGPRWRRR